MGQWWKHWCNGKDIGALVKTVVKDIDGLVGTWVETLVGCWNHWCIGGDTNGMVKICVETLVDGGDTVAVVGPLPPLAPIAKPNLI